MPAARLFPGSLELAIRAAGVEFSRHAEGARSLSEVRCLSLSDIRCFRRQPLLAEAGGDARKITVTLKE
jgi:hypothetical protein